MARSRRRKADAGSRPDDAESSPSGTGGFAGQIGLFETGNGLPHGPVAIALAIVLALIAYPISRVFRRGGRP